MKKNFLYAAAMTLCMSFAATACSDDNNGGNGGNGGNSVEEIDITTENASNWYAYMTEVARLLDRDASDLYDYWNVEYNNSGHSYAEIFKNHNVSGYFQTAALCVQQIIDGCYDIANEVGDAKIGDPYDMYVSGDTQGALYAVESWFSWHSREDYSNNIISIYSAIAGSRDVVVTSDQLNLESSTVAENSVYNVLKNNGYGELADQAMQAIKNAHDAILAIPAPFRSHINSQEALDAQEACLELATLLQNQLRGVFDAGQPLASDDLLNEVVNTYVDDVVLPTYLDLKNAAAELYADPMDCLPRTVGEERSLPLRTRGRQGAGPQHGQLALGCYSHCQHLEHGRPGPADLGRRLRRELFVHCRCAERPRVPHAGVPALQGRPGPHGAR